MATKVQDVMKTNLVEIGPKGTVREAARLMRTAGIGTLLVVEEGTLKGIVTDRDLVVRALAGQSKVDEILVEHVCSDEVVGVAPDDDVDRALEIMRERAIRRLPVLQDGRVLGVLTLGDLAVVRDRDTALGDISAAPANL